MSKSSLYPTRPLVRWLLVFVLFASAAFAARDDERIIRLQDQIQAQNNLVNNAKNAAEREKLEKSLQRFRQELEILQQRQAIDARQRASVTEVRRTSLDTLREGLRGIVRSVKDGEKRRDELTARREQAAGERDALSSRLDAMRAGTNRSADKEAEAEELIFTRNEELRAIALELDAVEAEIDLAREGDRLREGIKALELNSRPSIKALFDNYNSLRDQRKTGDRISGSGSYFEQNLRISQNELDLTQQKLASFDSELALLEQQATRTIFRSDPQAERLLATQKQQKKVLTDRLPIYTAQIDAGKRGLQALGQQQRIIALELAVLTERMDALKTGYWRRLRWPAVALTTLLVLQMLAGYVFLPIIYKNEELLLARRLARYAHVLIASGVFATFLFDDLSAIVSTMSLVSAAIVIALQDVCTSVFGWFVIMMGSKFGIGDRLEIDGTRGDVIDIQLLRTTMLEINGTLGDDHATGRVIAVPNNFIFKSKVFNYNDGHPFIWGKVDVTISFGHVAEVMSLLQDVLSEETAEEFAAARKAVVNFRKRYGVDDAVYQPRIATEIAGNDIKYSLYYVAHYRNFASMRSRIYRRLIAELGQRPHLQLSVTTLQLMHSNTPPPMGPSANASGVAPVTGAVGANGASGTTGGANGANGTSTGVSTPPFAETTTTSASRPPVWPELGVERQETR